jgi:toxin HigB-1
LIEHNRERSAVEKLKQSIDVAGGHGVNLPGFQLHPLKGNLADFWAVSVSGNWRVTFRFDSGHAVDVDYMDYH